MDIHTLDLNLLRLMEALYQQQSVSAAARQLGVSQPAVSAGLAKLRLFFDDSLFVRTGSGMRATPFADELQRPVMTVLETVRGQILRKSAFEPKDTRRIFTLCMSDIGQLIFLPRLQAALRDEAPMAAIRCVNLSRTELERELEEGRIDLAAGYYPQLESGNVLCQRLFEHPFTCLVREGHPTIGPEMNMDAFLLADHIVVGQQGRAAEIFENLLREIGLKGRVVLRLVDYLAAPRLVAESDLICVAPLALGRIFAGAGTGVRAVDLPMAYGAAPLRQFWHRRMQSDAGLIWLRSLMAREFVNRDPYPTPGSGH